jgi:hypothetical protein
MLFKVNRLNNLELLSVLNAVLSASNQHHRLQVTIPRSGIQNVKPDLLTFKVRVIVMLDLERDNRRSCVIHVCQDRDAGGRPIAQLAYTEAIRVFVVAEVDCVVGTALHVATAGVLVIPQKTD